MTTLSPNITKQIIEATKNPVDIVHQLLEQGHKAYYRIGEQNVVEYPDGKRYKITVKGKEIIEGDLFEEH